MLLQCFTVVLGLMLLLHTAPAASANVCENATLGAAVLSVVNLTYPGLAAVAAAAAAGDLPAACDALSAYYAASNTSAWLRRPQPAPSSRRVGGPTDDVVFKDVYAEGGLGSGRVPRNADGGLDWQFRGPRNDKEYENVLNRHATFVSALDAWSATGNAEYSAWLDRTVTDWAVHNPCPGAGLSHAVPQCFPVGDGGAPACAWGPASLPATQRCVTSYAESPWRLLEQGVRMQQPWPAVFFGLQGAANFSASARALSVLVAGEHLASLLAAGTEGVSNWAITQNYGLLATALSFPELSGAAAARDAALAALLSLLHSGVYPDGVETEQASGYDWDTALAFFSSLQLLQTAGAAAPPPAFKAATEQMFSYGAYVADALGCLPRNGDSDVCGRGYSDAAAAYFNRSDWTYLASNGARGAIPPSNASSGPSSVFPWAGQVAMRSGFGAGATWAWFDAGPYGSSVHGHRDKLALNLHARGAMLLVDSGRFAYSGNDLSATLHVAYARNASAHNTLTIGGCDQRAEPAVATAPLPAGAVVLSPAFDAACASMALYDTACLAGAAEHSRGVRLERGAGAGGDAREDGDFLLVVDVVQSDVARSVEARWHTHPNASVVEVNATSLVARVGGAQWSGQPLPAQACVVPASGGTGWAGVATARGALPPAPYAGWFSSSYDDASPATALEYRGSVAGGSGAGRGVWAWLIVPSAAPRGCSADLARVAGANLTHVTVEVELQGQAPRLIDVRFTL